MIMFYLRTLLLICLLAIAPYIFSDLAEEPIKLPLLVNIKPSRCEDTKICLTMIVKNESRIIERILNSAKDVIDCISICDTGSTDNTVELIEHFMEKNNIPGKVHHHQWENFGHNRTLSVQAAQQTIQELNLSPQNTFLLLLDADMMLVVSPDFKKSDLCEGEYLVIQKSHDLSYYNPRLILASIPWKCVGVTHEYWRCPYPHRREKLKTLEIDDRGDGGCKADKFERDIALLTQGLKDEPQNERYMFYLAQSYKCIQKYDEAIDWYTKRIEKGGWLEEVWYSKFMIGECYQVMGNWEKALNYYLEAYQCNPSRAETLQKIANYYRLNDKHELAYLYAKHGDQIPFPKNQLLFISHPVYDYQFDEELSISAYYTSFQSEGYEALNRLLLNKKVPQDVKTHAYKNLRFYVEPLKNTRFKSIDIALPLIREGSSLHYNPANPSITKTEDGYEVICRTVNYKQSGAMVFNMIDPEAPEVYKTKNYLVHYDRDFNLISQNEIIEDRPRRKYPWRPVEGLEDCRLVKLNKELWFTCSTDDASPHNLVQIVLCKLSDQKTDNVIKVEKFIPLHAKQQNPCEKNWLPFTLNNELLLIYGYDPFLIYKPNLDTGNCEIAISYEPEYDFSQFRGSAAPIAFDDGYLMMVHEVGFTDRRYYYHRFLYLDKDFILQKLSKPFIFKNNGIEFCLGMTKDHSESNLVIAVGIEDREAYLCTVDLETVKAMLEDLPNLRKIP